ncbi:hypothetical protein PSCFBP2116_05243 [Pseudomonas syringae]|uniref:Uncharacterized protein n=1 Tax=Pseudomonas syringae TaxID=317 RepID=A0A2K4WNA3_PSESX|nr:hypothetical protein CFBP3840_00311 [Pseudomonas syringae]SPD84726.1 hypothetical protein PSCFBP2116_05243 [Pseudomonas syringae]
MHKYLDLLAEAAKQDFKRIVTGFLLDARPRCQRQLKSDPLPC